MLLAQLDATKRKAVREELEWQGFGVMGANLLGCPRTDRADLAATLREQDAEDDCIVFETHAQEVLASKALRAQVRESWNIEELGQHYSEFIRLFRPLWQAMKDLDAPSPQDCFLARTLLIHEYRRLLLRDPQLPDELLPGIGKGARQGSCAATCTGWCRAGRRNTWPVRWKRRMGRCRMPTKVTIDALVGLAE